MAAFGNQAFAKRFTDLQKEPIQEQAAVFSRRFVFSLGDQFSDVFELQKQFEEACKGDEGGQNLSHAGAANFMQVHGQTRTAQQRRAELKDIDINNDGKVSFLEYLLLHYKIMILKEYFARNNMEPDVDMDSNGVGVTGVGERLVEELFNVPQGLDPELEKMMDEFSVERAKRLKKIENLEEKVAKGGVAGMAAKNELEQLKAADETDMNAVEARIKAAVKKAVAKSNKELATKQAQAEADEKQKIQDGRNKLADKIGKFGKRVSQRLSMGKKSE